MVTDRGGGRDSEVCRMTQSPGIAEFGVQLPALLSSVLSSGIVLAVGADQLFEATKWARSGMPQFREVLR